MWVLPSDASRVYYPQYVTVINPPSETDYRILESPAVYPAAVGQALGLLPPGLEGLREAANDTGSRRGVEQAREQLVEDYNLDPEHPEDSELLDRLLSRFDEGADLPNWSENVDELGLAQEELDEIGEECVSLALAREASPLAVDQLQERVTGSALEPIYKRRYPEAIERFGLEEVLLLREFPVAHVVAGYTREDSNPRSLSDLNFMFFEGEAGLRPMYGQRVTTEALLFRLDPARVLSWLVSSEAVEQPNTQQQLGWFFKNLRPVNSIFEPPQDLLTASVLGLIHSFSHLVIRSLAMRSGLRTETLSEQILPYNLAFLIYPGVRSDFVLGGLEHVFRNNLHECLFSMLDDPRCVFDPPCAQRGGACAVCMYLGEVTCERFNTALSRHYLFGGLRSSIEWQGYWDRV